MESGRDEELMSGPQKHQHTAFKPVVAHNQKQQIQRTRKGSFYVLMLQTSDEPIVEDTQKCQAALVSKALPVSLKQVVRSF